MRMCVCVCVCVFLHVCVCASCTDVTHYILGYRVLGSIVAFSLMTPEAIGAATVAQVSNRCVPVFQEQQVVRQPLSRLMKPGRVRRRNPGLLTAN